MGLSATQKDVAKEAGVSQATVSIVLSGRRADSISAGTAERVMAAAARLRYAPNRFAQALRTSQTMMLACVIPDITNPFYPALVRGAQAVAEQSGYDMLTFNSDGEPARELHYLNLALRGRVDGLIGAFFKLGLADIMPLVARGTPVVRLETSVKHGGELAVDDVFVDNCKAAQHLTRYLLGKGHRSVAMISGRGGPQSVRVQGYEQALIGAGLEPVVALDDEFTEAGGARAVVRLLAGGTRPSAVIAANDLMAIGAMNALAQRGIAVPGQLAVAGFDDIPAAQQVAPALTTVAQFQQKMGSKAAQLLLQRLSGQADGPGRACELGYQIVERSST